MANQNFTNVALYEATPPRLAERYAGGSSTLVVATDTMEVTALSTDDTVVLCRIPVDAIITSLQIACDDLATSSITIDLGLYEGFTDGVAASAVDDDCFATAVDVDGGVAFTEYRYEAANISTAGQPAWEVGSLSARPSYGNFDLVLHVNAASGGQAGTLSYKVEYLING